MVESGFSKKPLVNRNTLRINSLNQQRSLLLFYSGIKSKMTKKHYSNLSDKYGYEVNPTEGAINAIGYQHLGKNEYESAIEVFKYNIELYPKSANVYDSLGEAMEKSGRTDVAIENYKTAVKLGTKGNDRNLQVYKQNLERVEASE